MKAEIIKTINVLKKSGVIVYPTDTIWGVGCDATDEIAVAKVYKIKQRIASKSLIILVDSWQMLARYIPNIPAKVSCIINGSSKPTTVIYNDPIGLAKNVLAKDNTVAIRIVNDNFCKNIIRKLGKPIVSTSANISGSATPKNFNEIEASLLHKADYIVNLQFENTQNTTSQIVKIDNGGKIEFIRK